MSSNPSSTRKSKTQSLGSKSRKRSPSSSKIDIIQSLMNRRKVKAGHKYKTQADIISEHDIQEKKGGKYPLWLHIINLHPDEVQGAVFTETPSRFNRGESHALDYLSLIKEVVKKTGVTGNKKEDYIKKQRHKYIDKKAAKLKPPKKTALEIRYEKLMDKPSSLEERYNDLERSIQASGLLKKGGSRRRRRRRSGTRKANTA